MIACTGVVAGCATLPDVEEQIASSPPQDVTVVGPRGAVDAETADALLERLGQGPESETFLRRHLAFEQQINPENPLTAGNRVTLLQNGPQTYEAMFAAIDAARSHINLETFIFDAGEVGSRFSRLLRERAQAGIRVNVIYDSFGTMGTPNASFEEMKASGVRMVEFNPISPTAKKARPWRVNNRDHRKMLIVDGRTAFIGGINISDTYASSPSEQGSASGGSSGGASSDDAPIKGEGSGEEGWRDTHLQIEGPAVAQFQRLYVDTWRQQGADPLDETGFFPVPEQRGTALVRAISTTYEDPDSAIHSTLISAIQHAQSSVYVTIAYFAPDAQLLDALNAAARRDVDVQLILPSVTDSWAVFHVGRSHYAKLLEAGVRIHERRGPVMHSKTACVDGVWSTIGSTNLDWRSFVHNNEANAVILSRELAAQMLKMFRGDLAASDEISRSEWARRPLLNRLQELTARLGAYLL